MAETSRLLRPKMAIVAAIIAIVFGVATIISGSSVLFVDGPARASAGNYVPFVLWFNFLAGFVYITAGMGLFFWRRWAVNLSLWIAIATLLVFAAFALYALFGGAFELRTFGAMGLRSAVWLVIAYFCLKAWRRQLSL